MKVYFGASITRYRKLLPVYQSIVQIIEDLGHEVTSKHVIEEKTTEGDWEKDYVPDELYQRETDRLHDAGAMVAELTTPSWGTAFLIEEAIRTDKPLLSLYYSDDPEKAPLMLRGKKNLNLHIYTEDTLRHILKTFFDGLEK